MGRINRFFLLSGGEASTQAAVCWQSAGLVRTTSSRLFLFPLNIRITGLMRWAPTFPTLGLRKKAQNIIWFSRWDFLDDFTHFGIMNHGRLWFKLWNMHDSLHDACNFLGNLIVVNLGCVRRVHIYAFFWSFLGEPSHTYDAPGKEAGRACFWKKHAIFEME